MKTTVFALHVHESDHRWKFQKTYIKNHYDTLFTSFAFSARDS